MVSYDYLFKRAKTVLKTRYDIELDEKIWQTIEPFLNSRLKNILKEEKIQHEEIKYFLELFKRQNPSKFYLLELDVIKEIRNLQKQNQKPTIRKIPEPAEISIKDRKDRDFDTDDRTGFIYR
jgi:hypothetical protein